MKIKRAFIGAIATALYITLIASFMFYLQSVIPNETPSVLNPIAMLLLFVFSAGLTGFLVLGKPVMLYIDGKKKEAMMLLGYTLGFLFVFVLIAFAVILLMNI